MVQILLILLCFILFSTSLRLYNRLFNVGATFKGNSKGEDAYFALLQSDLAVFDGVGDWQKFNIDAGIFARTISKYAASYIEVERSTSKTKEVDLAQVLAFALESTIAESKLKENKIMGSCTACMISLDEKSEIVKVLNLGDSGALIVRPPPPSTTLSSTNKDWKIVYQSLAQYHEVNAPYQLGYYDLLPSNTSTLTVTNTQTPKTPTKSPMSTSNSTEKMSMQIKFDDPKKSSVISYIPIQLYDVIIVASDSLWDNLYIHEIVNILHDSLQDNTTTNILLGNGGTKMQELVNITLDRLVAEVLSAARSNERTTPWSEEQTLLLNQQLESRDRENKDKLLLLLEAVGNNVKKWFKFDKKMSKSSFSSAASSPSMTSQGNNQFSLKNETVSKEENIVRGGKDDDITIILAIVGK